MVCTKKNPTLYQKNPFLAQNVPKKTLGFFWHKLGTGGFWYIWGGGGLVHFGGGKFWEGFLYNLRGLWYN